MTQRSWFVFAKVNGDGEAREVATDDHSEAMDAIRNNMRVMIADAEVQGGVEAAKEKLRKLGYSTNGKKR